GRGRAARGRGAVRARGALPRDAAAPGVLPARGGDAVDRRPRCGARGSESPALGTARVHALARAARRTDARGAAGAEARSARVKVWGDISAPARVLGFRPLIAMLRAVGVR